MISRLPEDVLLALEVHLRRVDPIDLPVAPMGHSSVVIPVGAGGIDICPSRID